MAQAANVEEVDWACGRPKSVIIFKLRQGASITRFVGPSVRPSVGRSVKKI